MVAAIHVPKRVRQQPSEAPRIDFSHPLALGLRLFWHGGSPGFGATPTGLTPALLTENASGLPARGVNRQASAALIGSDKFISFRLSDVPYVPPPFTMVAATRGLPSYGAVGSFQGSNLGRGWLAGTTASLVQMDFGGVAEYSSGVGPGSGELGFVVTGNGGTCRFFVDRSFRASSAVGTVVAPVGGTWPIYFRIGAGTSGSLISNPATNAHIEYVALWNRALTDEEVIAVQSHPYQLLRRTRPTFILPAGTIYAASLTDTGTASESAASPLVRVSALTEAGTATESTAVSEANNASRTESATASESVVTAAVKVTTRTDTGTASETSTTVATLGASDTESNTASDSATASAVRAGYATDTGVASDSAVTAGTFVSADTEAATATDAASVSSAVASADTESATASDTAATVASFIAAMTAAAAAGDNAIGQRVEVRYDAPTTDITTGWTPSTGTSHAALIDEATADDADYIYATSAGLTDEVSVGTLSALATATPLYVDYRVTGVSGGASMTMALYEGATQRAIDTARTANGDYTLTVPASVVATISDLSALRLRVVSA